MSIELKNVSKKFGAVPALNDVSFTVKEGELMALLGPSGGGKTTVLRMIAGLTAIEQGAVHLHGRNVTRLPTQHRGDGFVFQHYALFHHIQ